jgi:membrane protease YdiL (CAAX protease family)
MAITAISSSLRFGRREPLASVWHTLGLLILIALPMISGIYVQRRGNTGAQIYIRHASLRFSIPAIIYLAILLIYTWWGVRKSGTGLSGLIGGSWINARTVFTDISISLGFLVTVIIVMGALTKVLGPSNAKGINVILPNGPVEILVWVILSLMAGIVEETVIRGYLQMQLCCWGLPVSLAVLAQAIIFGAGHAYEGFQAVVFISVFAILAGLLAIWRKSLRPGIIGHVAFDLLAILQRG